MNESTEFGDLSERAQALLKSLVEQYIDGGQPVGSNTLLEHSGVAASSATVRNVMSNLEKLGFVRAPHTSAGRIPTDLGYRCFVDTLLKVEPLHQLEADRIEHQFQGGNLDAMNPRDVVRRASTALSSLTRLAGVVTIARASHKSLRRIEFLPLAERKILVILVLNQNDVENRIVEVERDFTEAELRQTANFLNERFAGSDLSTIREALVSTLEQTRGDMNQLMQNAITLAGTAVEDSKKPDENLMVAGETHLMDYEDLSDMDQLRALFQAFSEQRDILHLLDRSMSAEGVKLFIGQESGYELLDACSVVTAPYSDGEGAVGVLAVIGPTRMAYERVIPIVDMTSKLLSSALKSGG